MGTWNVNRRSKLYTEAAMMKTQLAREDLRLGGHCARVGSIDVHGEDAGSVCEMKHVFHFAIIEPMPPKHVCRVQCYRNPVETSLDLSNLRDRHRQTTVSNRDRECGKCRATLRLKRRPKPPTTELSTDRTVFFCPPGKMSQQN